MDSRILVGAQWGDEGKGHPRRPTEILRGAA
jgi:adenylosuccinate synthase